jgi:hypothetical protein
MSERARVRTRGRSVCLESCLKWSSTVIGETPSDESRVKWWPSWRTRCPTLTRRLRGRPTTATVITCIIIITITIITLILIDIGASTRRRSRSTCRVTFPGGTRTIERGLSALTTLWCRPALWIIATIALGEFFFIQDYIFFYAIWRIRVGFARAIACIIALKRNLQKKRNKKTVIIILIEVIKNW